MLVPELRQYARAVDRCCDLARDDLLAVVAKLDTSKKKATRDALLLVAPAIVQKWGSLAAIAAAEYYESERDATLGGHHEAFLAEDEPLENIEESVRYACGHLFSKEGDDGR